MTSANTGSVSVAGSCLSEAAATHTKTSTVYLPDNSLTFVDITTTERLASYFIVVEPINLPGATATFAASSGSPGIAGTVSRITSSPSNTSEEIDIGWPADSPIQIQHSVVKIGATGALIPYRVRIIGIW